jgi:hypothetical protein
MKTDYFDCRLPLEGVVAEVETRIQPRPRMLSLEFTSTTKRKSCWQRELGNLCHSH